jgi:hypothetical protein
VGRGVSFVTSEYCKFYYYWRWPYDLFVVSETRGELSCKVEVTVTLVFFIVFICFLFEKTTR